MEDSISLMKVSDLMSRDLVIARIDEPASEAVSRMLDRNVGCIIVVDRGEVEGVITKGDILKKAFLLGLDAREVSCKKIMSHPAITVAPTATVEECARTMSERKISKLPVVEGKKPVGIITSTDIIKAEPVQIGYLEELVRARFIPHERG
jgi:CBS domain-containing protein